MSSRIHVKADVRVKSDARVKSDPCQVRCPCRAVSSQARVNACCAMPCQIPACQRVRVMSARPCHVSDTKFDVFEPDRNFGQPDLDLAGTLRSWPWPGQNFEIVVTAWPELWRHGHGQDQQFYTFLQYHLRKFVYELT